jgi:hypothetical protein
VTLAQDFTLAPVGAFGEKLHDCKVDALRTVGVSEGLPDYECWFARTEAGLKARDLPDGRLTIHLAHGCAVSAKAEW